jgi:hypothetical protein
MSSSVIRALVIVAFALSSYHACAQTFSLGVGGGVLAVQSPDFYTRPTSQPGIYLENGYFSYSSGLDFHSALQLRSLIDCSFKDINVGLSLEFTYAVLRGKGQARFFVGDTPTPTSLTTKLDLWSLGLAGRFYLLVADWSPFLSVAGRMNRYRELRFTYGDEDYWSEYNSTKGYSRFLLGLGTGCDIALNSTLSTRVEFQHSWNNLDGHREGEEPFRSLDMSITILYVVVN